MSLGIPGVNAALPEPPHIQSTKTRIPADSQLGVALTALIFALICLMVILTLARFLYNRHQAIKYPGNKGLNKKTRHAIPKLTLKPDDLPRYSDCPICLAEFCAGEELRVLPNCAHGFHVRCVDRWLREHSTCPSCRQIVVSCGECDDDDDEAREKQRQQHVLDRHVP